MSKIILSRHADTLDTALVRQIVYTLDLGARREGDYLKIYPGNLIAGRGLYVMPKYSASTREPDSAEPYHEIASLYCDEGWQDDCLRSDGTTGFNDAWIEMCSMNPVLRLIIARWDPAWKAKPSGMRGRGSHNRAMHAQYVKRIDALAVDEPEFNERFDWPVSTANTNYTG